MYQSIKKTRQDCWNYQKRRNENNNVCVGSATGQGRHQARTDGQCQQGKGKLIKETLVIKTQ